MNMRPQNGSMSMLRKKIKVPKPENPKKIEEKKAILQELEEENADDPFSARFKGAGVFGDDDDDDDHDPFA